MALAVAVPAPVASPEPAPEPQVYYGGYPTAYSYGYPAAYYGWGAIWLIKFSLRTISFEREDQL